MSNGDISIKNWIIVPAVITLLVTLLRLTGELMRWNELFFGRGSGGGGSIVGISYLVPIFGIYFGYKLASAGHRPESLGKAALWLVLGLVASIALSIGVFALSPQPSILGGIGGLITLAIVYWLASKGWSSLVRILTAYGFAARIPVAIVALLAMYGNWGTHYELGPEGYEQPNLFLRWLEIGLFPQMTVWIVYTIVFGGLFACLGALFARKSA
ncbi:MAG TPA: hypothetical protein VLV83_25320 [Acidobacteriota bacterium]|nr:hypothetical protein [Acidobacteriota bacterium]